MSSQRYQEFIAERTRLLERIKELEAENAELRKRLGEPVNPVPSASNAMQNLSLQEKMDLFCSLFKGRDDVFARRWYSKTSGKAGYQPVCQNEWTPLCDKRKYKCADCPNRQFSPLTYNDYYRHLMANGIEIVLYTKEENDDVIRLQHQGVSVIYNDHLSLHAAIIDKSTIWYGSVNILGYCSLEDNLIRFNNPEIASNLLDSLQKST
jgi:hypothetical protein